LALVALVCLLNQLQKSNVLVNDRLVRNAKYKTAGVYTSQPDVIASKSRCALLHAALMCLLRSRRATNLNYTLATLLRDLGLRVGDEDKQKIENALDDVRLLPANFSRYYLSSLADTSQTRSTTT
jgi:hypothetical protein